MNDLNARLDSLATRTNAIIERLNNIKSILTERYGFDFVESFDRIDCSICGESTTNNLTLVECTHSFCKKCIHEWVDVYHKNTCPNCRTVIISPLSTT